MLILAIVAQLILGCLVVGWVLATKWAWDNYEQVSHNHDMMKIQRYKPLPKLLACPHKWDMADPDGACEHCGTDFMRGAQDEG